MYRIELATLGQMDDVRALFLEYWAFLEVSPCFQNFEQELSGLPGVYDPILLSFDSEGGLAGCAALRPLTNTAAEMKRLFVRPEHRGHGLGRRLAEAIIDIARAKGYRSICLDSLPKLEQAIAMYRRMGFHEIAPYYENPAPGVIFMELNLCQQTKPQAAS